MEVEDDPGAGEDNEDVHGEDDDDVEQRAPGKVKCQKGGLNGAHGLLPKQRQNAVDDRYLGAHERQDKHN